MLKKLNQKLSGFRGLLAYWLPFAVAYADTITINLTGLTGDNLKAAAVLAALPTLKLIWTDARPKILNWIADNLAR